MRLRLRPRKPRNFANPDVLRKYLKGRRILAACESSSACGLESRVSYAPKKDMGSYTSKGYKTYGAKS